MQQNTFEIELQGQKLSFKAGEHHETIHDAVNLAAERIRRAEERAKGAPSHKVAVLALLDLAEEYLRAKKEFTNYREDVSGKSEKLFQLIETDAK